MNVVWVRLALENTASARLAAGDDELLRRNP
jgi:hypothetical protein